MNLFEYIKSQLPRPNISIMYNLGATEEIVNYVKHTTWNTNLNIIKDMCSSDEYTIEDYLAVIPKPGEEIIFENATVISEDTITVDILDINIEIAIETDGESGDRTIVTKNIHYNSKAKDTTAIIPENISNAISEAIKSLDADDLHDYIDSLQESTLILNES